MKKETVIIISISVLCAIFLLSAIIGLAAKSAAVKEGEALEERLQQVAENNATLAKTVKKLGDARKSLEVQLKDSEESLNAVTSEAEERNKILLAEIDSKDEELKKFREIAGKYEKESRKLIAEDKTLRTENAELKAQHKSLTTFKKESEKKIQKLEKDAKSLSKKESATSLGMVVIK